MARKINSSYLLMTKLPMKRLRGKKITFMLSYFLDLNFFFKGFEHKLLIFRFM